MHDPRLVGVWRSDAKRTGRELARHSGAEHEGSALVSYEPLLDAEVISHLHFGGSHVWVAVGTGLFREFFKTGTTV